ncbi:glycosyltransferase 8 domain-containing protein 2-like [Anguilla anguilla]|uniref:glycosyltransferase 8 domain-containing protein 2-like n=1 Tax=Anguilla anguilla TaxID=7936 RepID=UPI0015B15D54|nr:glycosyltransferase 8 domain-containing protein 2-like [Anguilla anguilla]XP_035281656.1 glycosyltransferase 8 domain-containing protein 2-like [Anguilla anguilla]
MVQLRKLNRVLLMLLILMMYIILYSKVHKVQLPNGNTGESGGVKMEPGVTHKAAGREKPEEAEMLEKVETVAQVEEVDGNAILVVICAAKERMGGAMTTINSVRSNTEANVIFYIVTLRDAVSYTRQYIENSDLKNIKFKILEFNPMVLKGKVKSDSTRPDLKHPLNFVRFYLPLLVIGHKKVIYLDDDVIVQGDIQDLYNTKLDPGHAAAFPTDCDLPSDVVRSMGMQTTYMGFLDYRKMQVRDLGINPSECSFNPGVIVVDVEEWRRQKITKQLEGWMQSNVRDNLYTSSMAGGVATPPMLIAFYQKYSDIDANWHIGHLGWSPDTWYSEAFLHTANLLHWNGRFKPWDFPCVHMELWEKWYVPDPTGRFVLVRPES